jgi:RNA polymerase sigma-70 factor, ECF subfamily
MAVATVMPSEYGATGDTDATDGFDLVFAEYYQPIYRYVLRMIGDPEDAADLTVTSFEKALKAWPRRTADLKVRPWLYRIATNTCLDELRRRRLIRWLPLAVFGQSAPHPVATDDPEDSAVRGENQREVRAALARLPDKYRTALLLREGEGLSCEQIGETLGISRAAAKVLLFRARERLREAYFALETEARS